MFVFTLLSSLEKVFLKYTPPTAEFSSASAFLNEVFSFQIGYTYKSDTDWRRKIGFDMKISSPLADCITMREVVNVPSEYPPTTLFFAAQPTYPACHRNIRAPVRRETTTFSQPTPDCIPICSYRLKTAVLKPSKTHGIHCGSL